MKKPKSKKRKSWYGIKCIFQHDGLAEEANMTVYEERVVLMRARSFAKALQLAEAEAAEYASSLNKVTYSGFASAYRMSDPKLKRGAEVYSLMRKSTLSKNDFLDRYHDDGSECTQ